jgi:hypothetical protein
MPPNVKAPNVRTGPHLDLLLQTVSNRPATSVGLVLPDLEDRRNLPGSDTRYRSPP